MLSAFHGNQSDGSIPDAIAGPVEPSDAPEPETTAAAMLPACFFRSCEHCGTGALPFIALGGSRR